jgi:hypothetical protein
MSRRVSLLLLGAISAVALLVSAAAAAGGNTTSSRGARQAATPPTTVPVLATGVAPLTNGIVTATAEPVLQNVGDSAPVMQIASAPIDASGNFTVRADPNTGAMASAVAHAVATNNGWVNLDLVEVGANGETTVQSISRQFAGVSGQPLPGAAPGTAAARSLTSGHWAGEDGTTKVGPAYVKISAASSLGAARGAMHAAGPYCFLTSTLVSQANEDTIIGELHTANDTSAYFRYGKTADTSPDVGIEIGGSGTWSVSGSYHTGNSTGSYAQYNEGDQFGYKLPSGFLYDDYHYVWNLSGCGNNYFQAQQDEWTLSPHGTIDPPPSADYNHNLDNNCKNSSYPSSFGINSSWSRSSNDFNDFSGAFSVFGFSGGAQSGASTYVVIHYSFGSGTNTHYLCGNDNYIAYAHRVFAGFG